MSKDYFNDFAKAIVVRYDFAEAASITRIIQEDVFQSRNSTALSEVDIQQLKDIESKLLAGQPLQYILGEADFYGLKLKVDDRVLIPRQDTETLVHSVIEYVRSKPWNHQVKILDIGTGSGCIALALKKELDLVDVLAVDVSIAALNLARENNQLNNLCVQFERFDLLKEESWGHLGQFDIIVSNPPYIPPSEKGLMPEHVKEYEPALALFVPEQDALLFYRKLALFGQQHLVEKGLLAVEVNEFRAKETVHVFKQHEYQEIQIVKDFAQADRVVFGMYHLL